MKRKRNGEGFQQAFQATEGEAERQRALSALSRRTWFGIAVLAGVLGLAAFLLFYNLDGRLFWSDEAETAVLARNVARFGLPYTDDGRNLITLFGPDIDNNADGLWTWSPWLPHYITAASFWLFGPSTWAARIPFAAIGLLSVVYLAFLAHRIYHRWAITCAAAYLWATSELFLLHARQCRYYSLVMLAQLMLVHGVWLLMRQQRQASWLVRLALAVQFYSNYMMVAANVPVMAGLALLWRKRYPELFRGMLAAGTMLAVLALPWLVYARLWNQPSNCQTEGVGLKAAYYACETSFHILPLVFVLLPLSDFFVRLYRAVRTNGSPAPISGKRDKKLSEPQTANTGGAAGIWRQLSRRCAPLLTILKNSRPRLTPSDSINRRWETMLLLCLPSFVLVVMFAPGMAFFRYLLPVAPLLTLLLAVWLVRYIPNLAMIAAFVLALTLHNVFGGLSDGALPIGGHQARWRLIDFIQSITTPYHDRTESVVAFLKKAAQPGQTLVVNDPEFALQFYLPLKVLDDHLPMKPVQQLPDWILSESASGILALPLRQLPEQLLRHYEPIKVRVPQSTHHGGVPDPDSYEFFTAKGEYYLTLYKKKSELLKPTINNTR